MYKWFVIKRIFRGLLIYLTVIVALSFLFNTVREKTLYSQIEEQVRQETMNLRDVTPEQLSNFRELRKEELYQQNWLDRSYMERVSYQAWSAITFRFGNATNIKSASGDRRVSVILAEAVPRTM